MWTNIEELTDKWSSAEYDSFVAGDPSMMAMGDSATEARKRWNDQIEGAAMDMEADQNVRLTILTCVQMLLAALEGMITVVSILQQHVL